MMKVLELTKNRWKYMILPIVIILAGIVMYFVHGGFNFDVEFMGGSRLQVTLPDGTSNEDVQKFLEEKFNVDVTVQSGETAGSVVIKTPPIEGELTVASEDSEDPANESPVFTALQEKYNLEDSALIDNTTASASFGLEVQRKALLYTLLAIVCILIYIAIRFEWRSAVMAVMALAINVLVMIAVYAITHIAINTTFIAAMLTVVGYSINNTIVIFDRIRENLKGRRKTESISQMSDRSVSETVGRTVNSTITTLITIVLVYILGVTTIRNFALPLIVGVIIGAYSSIFIAPGFWAAWKESEMKNRAAAALERKASKGKKN